MKRLLSLFLLSSFRLYVRKRQEKLNSRMNDPSSVTRRMYNFVFSGPIVLVGSLAANAEEPRVVEHRPMGAYEVLETHPKCSGAGKIAYVVVFDSTLDAGGYFLGSSGNGPAICTVTENKGTRQLVTTIPCGANVPEPETSSEEYPWQTFCRATTELRPAEMRLVGTLTGCVTLEGHSLVEGQWMVTTTRPSGSTVTRGAYDDERLHVDFIATSFDKGRKLPPYLDVWIDVEDVSLEASDARVQATGTAKLKLVEESKWACANGEANCEVEPLERPFEVTSYICLSDSLEGAAILLERFQTGRREN